MKKEIVITHKNEVFTNTKIISEMLEVPHKVLINTIKALIDNKENKGTAKPLKFPQKFIEATFKNKMGREYKMYSLNEQAYMKVAMRLGGYEKAEIVQDAIIEAFSLMKTSLLNQSNQTWLSARKDGKTSRIEQTDVIKDFVDYATEQGSKSAKMYYMNVTKMTNKALELLVQVQDNTPIRDLCTITELGYVQMLDNRARQSMEHGMKNNLPYKYIYKLAKEQVNELADSLNFTPKQIKQ